jgi:peptidyl-prolyl cis-trans isomerase SurA
MRLTSLILSLGLGLISATTGLAQTGPFSPVIRVNDSAITGYELEQRIKFLQLLRFPGDIPAEAEKGLIEDRLRLATARMVGLKLTDEQIAAGMAEFAGRANLDTDQFLAAIAQGGVEPETFRDFVEAGIAWREMVRGRFGGRVTATEAEVDRAMSADTGRGAGPRVLLSEIILRARAGEVGRVRRIAADIAENAASESAFAEAARNVSLAPSRDNGGRVDWIPLSNLPPQAQAAIGKLGQGQISEPVPLQGYVGLFMLRGLQEGGDIAPSQVVIDYAQLTLPAGAQAEAQRLQANARSCDELYSLTDGGQIQRQKARRGQIAGDIGAELDRLDTNETSANLRRSGGQIVLLMLCSRTATLAEGNIAPPPLPAIPLTPALTADGDVIPSVVEGLGYGYGPTRDQAREEVVNRKIAQLAEAWLAELKAGAIISRP